MCLTPLCFRPSLWSKAILSKRPCPWTVVFSGQSLIVSRLILYQWLYSIVQNKETFFFFSKHLLKTAVPCCFGNLGMPPHFLIWSKSGPTVWSSSAIFYKQTKSSLAEAYQQYPLSLTPPLCFSFTVTCPSHLSANHPDFCSLLLPISNLSLTISHSLSFKLSFVPFLFFTLFTPLFYNSPLSPPLSPCHFSMTS